MHVFIMRVTGVGDTMTPSVTPVSSRLRYLVRSPNLCDSLSAGCVADSRRETRPRWCAAPRSSLVRRVRVSQRARSLVADDHYNVLQLWAMSFHCGLARWKPGRG